MSSQGVEPQEKMGNKCQDNVNLKSDRCGSGQNVVVSAVSGCNNDKDFSDPRNGTDRNCGHACSKLNGSTTTAGALRYALHLRFLCPRKKYLRSDQRSRSDLAV